MPKIVLGICIGVIVVIGLVAWWLYRLFHGGGEGL